jgi:RND superfamily putative drug exporter
VVTSAAFIMIVVFLSFVASPVPSLKMLGLGLATAILVDATIVRMVLVPATMALLGKANWWLPVWLDRVLPRLAVDGTPTETDVVPDRHAVSLSSSRVMASRTMRRPISNSSAKS